jgi:CRP-like cAMP-binding protein
MIDFIDYRHSIYPLSDPARAAFAAIMRPLDIPKKGFLVRPGSINDKVFFIRKGLVRCYYIKASPKGKKEVSGHCLEESFDIRAY